MQTLLLVFFPVVLGVAIVLVRLGVSRPERATLVVAVVVVVAGLGGTGVELAVGIADRQVDYRGTLDKQDFSASRDEADRDPEATKDAAYLSELDGEMTKPSASSPALVVWSIAKLAPWLLATIVLVLVLPILRAARRADPFWRGATARLNAIGILLLLGIPGVATAQFLAATVLSSGNAIDPFPAPKLTITLAQLLPGFLVLALVGIFRRGVELRDLESHTI